MRLTHTHRPFHTSQLHQIKPNDHLTTTQNAKKRKTMAKMTKSFKVGGGPLHFKFSPPSHGPVPSTHMDSKHAEVILAWETGFGDALFRLSARWTTSEVQRIIREKIPNLSKHDEVRLAWQTGDPSALFLLCATWTTSEVQRIIRETIAEGAQKNDTMSLVDQALCNGGQCKWEWWPCWQIRMKFSMKFSLYSPNEFAERAWKTIQASTREEEHAKEDHDSRLDFHQKNGWYFHMRPFFATADEKNDFAVMVSLATLFLNHGTLESSEVFTLFNQIKSDVNKEQILAFIDLRKELSETEENGKIQSILDGLTINLTFDQTFDELLLRSLSEF